MKKETTGSAMAEKERSTDTAIGADGMSEKGTVEPIFVDWDGPDDPNNPFNWSKRRKWVISSVGIMFCALVSLSVSGYSISVGSVQEELQCSRILALLGITMFTITFGAAPLLLAPLSEVYGRSHIYLVSAFIFAVFFIPQALAKNIETILVTRFISGIAGSTAVSLVGGTLSDVWKGPERGGPMSLFSWAAFGTTGLAPVMFGYLAQTHGFRYVNWIMFAMSALFTIVLIPVLDETRASVLLSRKAARLRKETGDERYVSKEDYERGSIREMMKTSLSRPIKMLLTEPVLIAFTVWISFTWGVLYLTLVSIPLVFGEIYHFNTGESGLVYLTQVFGSTLGFACDWYCNKLYLKNVGKRGPEARLYTAFVGGTCVPIGAFIYAFTAFSQCHWIGTCVGITILYVGMFCVYLSTFSYLADSYSLYASSALSAMSFVRNVVGAVFPLFVTAMYESLGVQGAGGLTAGIGTLLSITPFVLFKYGSRLRARSPFAQELARLEAEHAASLAKTPVVKEGPTASTNRVSAEELKEVLP
ncbi:MFS transporter [Sporobolomyces salmoneus]|uniref:MFS transporter n=1 Tax=Sporobolomyces salmoneus TaxID=183962 RepID=UPI00317F82B7